MLRADPAAAAAWAAARGAMDEAGLARMAAPEEMVGPTVLLLSEAASFCTGVDLVVDGGFICW